MKKLFAIILSLTMMVCICACGSNGTATNVPTGINDNHEAHSNNSTNQVQNAGNIIDAGAMILTEMGTVPDGVSFTSGGIITKSEGEKVQVLNQNGASFNDKWYDDVDSIITNGICVVSNEDTSGKELLGIVDSISENELVPCEAVEVVKLSDRFILLGYETGICSDEDKFGFYFIDSETVNYKGYGKILDLERGQVVSGIEITTSKYDVSAAGNMIFVDKDHRTTDVYTAEGKLSGTYEFIYAYPESGLALQYTAEGICVYDADMNLVSTLVQNDFNDDYKPIDGTSEMLLHEYVKDGSYHYYVTDLSGKALTAEYDRILQVYPEGFLSISEDDSISIVDFAGNVIVPNNAGYREPGYFVAQVQGDGYYVYDITGKKINETAMTDGYSGLIIKDDSGKILVLESGEMLAAEGYARVQTGSLVLIESTLYDVISGNAVLNDVDACVATGDNLYVWDNEKPVMQRNLSPEADLPSN